MIDHLHDSAEKIDDEKIYGSIYQLFPVEVQHSSCDK